MDHTKAYDAPEVLMSPLPEAYHNAPQVSSYQHTPASTYVSPSSINMDKIPSDVQRSAFAQPDVASSREKRICGLRPREFCMAIAIAVLAIAVIGLSAGVGVAVHKYNDANSKLDETAESSTGYNTITNGCSNDPDGTTGKTYKSRFFSSSAYTMHCNKDTPHSALISVFAPSFNACMEACSAWNSYRKTNNDTESSECNAVSFVPYWTDLSDALTVKARGSCFIKPGTQVASNLSTPDIDTECHAAILN